MIPAAWGFAIQLLSKVDMKPLLRFLAKNWKEVMLIASVVWIVLCLQWHCGSRPSPADYGDSTLVRVDTHWVYVDTNLILKLKGYDITPKTTVLDSSQRWRPTKVQYNGNTCSDSVRVLIQLVELLEKELKRKDSLLIFATALNTYNSEVRNDSITVNIGIRTKGILLEEPEISYRWIAPIPVIEKHFEKALPPKRRFGIGVAVGPFFMLPTTVAGVDASIKLHYLDRRYQVFTLEPGLISMQSSGWYVKIGYSRFF